MAYLTNFSFEFFYKIFPEDASQPLLYHGAKKSKMTKNSNQGGSCLKAEPPPPPLEAIVVIFGRSWLIFFVWKVLDYEKSHQFCVRMRSSNHLGDAKMSKKGTSLRRI